MNNYFITVWKILSGSYMELTESFFCMYSKYQLVSNNTAYVHLIPKLNNFMLLCKAAGLHRRWEWEFTLHIYRFVSSESRVEYRVSFDVALTKLKLKHVRAAFFFWSVGITVSILGFTMEHLKNMFMSKVQYV